MCTLLAKFRLDHSVLYRLTPTALARHCQGVLPNELFEQCCQSLAKFSFSPELSTPRELPGNIKSGLHIGSAFCREATSLRVGNNGFNLILAL